MMIGLRLETAKQVVEIISLAKSHESYGLEVKVTSQMRKCQWLL